MDDWIRDLPFFRLFVPGLAYSLMISVGALFFGSVVGLIAGVARSTGPRWLQLLVGLYVELVRSVPLLILLFFVFFALPTLTGFRLSPLIAAIATQSFYLGAYMTETVKAGILAVPRGQWEATNALGLSYLQAMTRVILPQALRVTIPPTIGLLVTSVKESSLASIIGVVEITHTATLIRQANFSVWPPLLTVTAIYLVLNLILSSLGAASESWAARQRRRIT